MKQKQKYWKFQALAGKVWSSFLSTFGVSLMATILGISGIILLLEAAVQAQDGTSSEATEGVPDVIQYLHHLNFRSGNTVAVFEASTGTDIDKPILLATGTMAIGASNSNNWNTASSSFIGGGADNSIYASPDTVIVGGTKNTIGTGSPGGLIMWGKENTIERDSPYGLIAGGQQNKITDSEISLILWGNGNSISESDNGIILGTKNAIKEGKNNIVVGSNVAMTGISDTFVWSDGAGGTFSPQSSEAFYINTTNGVGINENNPKAMFDSNGAVKFWSWALPSCDNDNKGLIIYYKNELCGCNDAKTRVSLTDSFTGGCK